MPTSTRAANLPFGKIKEIRNLLLIEVPQENHYYLTVYGKVNDSYYWVLFVGVSIKQ